MKSLLLTGHERPISYIHFNPDGDLMFSCGKDGALNCWMLKAKKKFGRYSTGKAMVANCDITLDGEQLIATSADSKLFIFEVSTGRELFAVSEQGPVKFAEWNRMPGKQDKFVLSQDGFGNKSKPALKVYVKRGDKYELMVQIGGIKSKCTRVHWGPFDETLISTHDDGTMCIWNADTAELIQKIDAHTGSITDVDFTEDRLLMLTCSADTTGKLWDTVNFQVIKTYQTNRPLNSCAISPLWNSEDNRRPHVAFGGGQSAERVALSSATEGRFEALLYHMVFAYELASLAVHFSPINCIRFFPDGMGFATGAEEGRITVVPFDDEYLKKVEV